jgi:type IV pilus assembly protein PilW
MAVGLLLLVSVFRVFLSNKQTYELTEDLSRLQENGRFALEAMARSLRMAGYVGCGHNVEVVDNVAFDAGSQPRGMPSDFGTPVGSSVAGPGIEGVDSLTSQVTPPSGWTVVAGTDSVTARYVAGPGLRLASASGASSVTGLGTTTLAAGDLASIVDCSSGLIFTVSGVSRSGGNSVITATGGLPRTFPAAPTNQLFPSVAPVRAVRYYLARDAGGVPSLRRQTAVGDDELVEGVEQMQLLYGIDTGGDGQPDRYVAAGSADLDSSAEWRNVVSVRVGVLLRTVDEYGAESDTRSYDLFTGAAFANLAACGGGAGCVDPADLRVRRRVFSTTVLLRNRT